MYDVTALGELLIDFTYVGSDIHGFPTMVAHPGGAPANYLAALSKFGAKTAFIGKVGSDSFGRLLISTIEAVGIETCGLVQSDDVFTTIAFVFLDETGNREFSFSRKPGADTCLRFDEIKLNLIDEAKIVHFGTLSLTDEPVRSSTYKAIDYARTRGKLITFDPNLRKPLWDSLENAKAQISWGLTKADIVKISDEEVNFMWGMGPEEGSEFLLNSYGTKLVFVTCGSEGCYYRNASTFGHVPGLKNIYVADTTGAGDIFFGSAIWKLLQAENPPENLNRDALEEIVMFANVAAGLSTTKQGGLSSVPQYAEVKRQLEMLYSI